MDAYIPYLLIVGFVAFFGWRIYSFKKVKALLPALLAEGAVVVDVRTPQEYSGGARPGSINIPLNELAARSKELDKNRTIILCCASGTRSGVAAGMLKQLGFAKTLNAGPWMNTLV